MGINQCSRGNVLWKATGLSLHTLKSFGVGNRIDVDGNLLFYQIQGSGGKSIEMIVQEMALLLKQIAHSGGFIVTIVMDGDARPDCKRASWERRKEASLAKINRMYCRFKVIELSSRLENEAMNQEKRKETETELRLFNQAAASFEKKCGQVGISNNFCDLLMRRLRLNGSLKINENGGFVSSQILKARFQADYVIAVRSVENKNDFIYSSDSDFAALLGNDCVLIDEVKNRGSRLMKKKKNKNAKDSQEIILDSTAFSVSLSGASNKKMMKLQQCLRGDDSSCAVKSDNKSKIVWTKAKRPLFEDKDIRLRAHIALALGCDVFQGLKYCGPAKAEKILEAINEKNNGSTGLSATKAFESFLINGLRNKTMSTKNKNESSFIDDNTENSIDASYGLVDTLVDAFLYEPGVVAQNLEVSNDQEENDILDQLDQTEQVNRGFNDEDVTKSNNINDCFLSEKNSDRSDSSVSSDDEEQSVRESNEEETRHPYVTDEMPSSLARYVKSFKMDGSIQIKDGASLCRCSGTSSTRGHFFPRFEGTWKCNLCNANFCKTCAYVPDLDNKKKTKQYYKYDCEDAYCIDCFKYHRLGNDNDSMTTNSLSEAEMSVELNAKFGVQLNDKSATFGETLDIYEAYINSPDNIHDHHLRLVREKIKFPLFASTTLDDVDPQCPISKTGKKFNLKNGGRFISDSSLVKDEELPEILDLFASFLEVDPKKHVHENKSDIGQFGYLPNVILNLAYHSRIDSGFRLVKRCVRHTFNINTPPLIDTSVEFFRLKSNSK